MIIVGVALIAVSATELFAARQAIQARAQENAMSPLPRPYQQFGVEQPAAYAAYEALGEAVSTSGPLDSKTRELIKLGMAAANGSESGVESHTHRALEAGATAHEIEHAVMLGINTLGFSTMMAALTWAKQAIAGHHS
jgi:AhpD family alkylhydroperoxidase